MFQWAPLAIGNRLAATRRLCVAERELHVQMPVRAPLRVLRVAAKRNGGLSGPVLVVMVMMMRMIGAMMLGTLARL